mmetsp:Transcript_38995/g.107364  ORF Transcript_38995/g.107364 Transcript_38995/m.107364 type:complete len:336 (-) Transcript_38995:302-1309(-)
MAPRSVLDRQLPRRMAVASSTLPEAPSKASRACCSVKPMATSCCTPGSPPPPPSPPPRPPAPPSPPPALASAPEHISMACSKLFPHARRALCACCSGNPMAIRDARASLSTAPCDASAGAAPPRLASSSPSSPPWPAASPPPPPPGVAPPVRAPSACSKSPPFRASAARESLSEKPMATRLSTASWSTPTIPMAICTSLPVISKASRAFSTGMPMSVNCASAAGSTSSLFARPARALAFALVFADGLIFGFAATFAAGSAPGSESLSGIGLERDDWAALLVEAGTCLAGASLLGMILSFNTLSTLHLCIIALESPLIPFTSPMASPVFICCVGWS